MRIARAVSFACALVLASAAHAERIEVFKLTAQRVNTLPGTLVYDIDAIDALTESLSVGLPADPARAQRIAQQRFEAMGEAQRASLEHAARVLGQAAHYRLEKAPAIVIEREAVIYGVSDVAQALKIYRRWRAQGGAQ